MVVDDLDVVGIASGPSETDTPLVVDANAVLAVTIAFKLLEAISRWESEILQTHRGVHVAKLSEHAAPKIRRETPYVLARPETLGIAVSKMLDHVRIVTYYVTMRKSSFWSR